jgi:cellulose synthase/poly-beta-1,6-N-acetylglucosamine synthase-like glycosyltransferase
VSESERPDVRSGEVALLWFVALYPPVVAAMWIAGGAVFRLLDERVVFDGRDTWPGVTLLVPAYNEELVIGTCVKAALRARLTVTRDSRAGRRLH